MNMHLGHATAGIARKVVVFIAVTATLIATTPPLQAATKATARKKATAKTTTKTVATTAAPTVPSTTSAPVATTSVSTIPRGGTMVAAITSDPGQLNPAITTSGAVHSASELMFNGLVELDEQGKPTPELAESWTVNSGDYTFKLRKGVLWHDGQPFTSADVKYTFEEVQIGRAHV